MKNPATNDLNSGSGDKHAHIGRHDHGSHQNHDHDYRGMEKNRLFLSLFITFVMFVVEVAGGIIANSLALLSDAGHMFTHIIALGISVVAINFSEREPTDKMTFGYYRAEIMAAFVNGVTLFILTFWIAYEAAGRFFAPRTINSVQMFWIALFGLIVNVITALILKEASHRNINVRSAFLHMLGDTLSSVGVILGAVAIYYKGWLVVDPLISVALCIPIVIWSYHLITESVDILLEATPKDVDLNEVTEAMIEIDMVKVVHDVHIWTLTSGVYSMSAHVGVQELHISETTALLDKINKILKDRFNIGHCTIQFECVDRCVAGSR